MTNELQQVVADDRAAGDVCFRCGYDLRGLADEVGCPECGLQAGRSRMPTEELRHARPAWLWKLSAGIWLMLAALVGAGVWAMVQEPLQDWLLLKADRSWTLGPGPAVIMTGNQVWIWLSDNLPMIGAEVAAAMLLLGAVLVTWPEGRPGADRRDRIRRWAIRLTSAVPLGVLTLFHISIAWSALYHLGTGVVVSLLAICAVCPVLLFFQLRHLARRVLSAHLAEHCAIVGIGVSATLVVWAVFAAVMAWAGDRLEAWTLRSTSWIVLMTLLITAALLFYLWAIYLAVRFAAAFGKARRLAVDAWRRADLARG